MGWAPPLTANRQSPDVPITPPKKQSTAALIRRFEPDVNRFFVLFLKDGGVSADYAKRQTRRRKGVDASNGVMPLRKRPAPIPYGVTSMG